MKTCLLSALLGLGICQIVKAQQTLLIPYGEPSVLTMAPDARSGGMGNTGAALSSDANATFWNVGQLAAASRDFGASVSYGPWLSSLTDDLWSGYASVYKKIGDKQAVGLSATYFSNNYFNTSNWRDYALAASYSRQLGKHFSLGATVKYISARTGYFIGPQGTTIEATAVAGDIGAYFHSDRNEGQSGRKVAWSFGAVLSNLGPKLEYDNNTPQFLPANLRLGGAFSYTATGKHKLNLLLDLNKLMVPTPREMSNGNQKPVVKGMIQSFSDAPGGFSEELKEVQLGFGAEYWYKNTLAVRGGYHGENEEKGGRSFFTVGAGGVFLKNYALDLSYNFPANDTALAENFRATVSVYFGK